MFEDLLRKLKEQQEYYYGGAIDFDAPLIPADFTPEQIAQCKRYAYSRIKNEQPNLENKQYRLAMSDYAKNDIVDKMCRYFEEAVEDLRKTI